MDRSINQIIDAYNPDAPLAEASTIPSGWYTDGRLFELEKESVSPRSWQVAARLDQLTNPGDYVTAEIADEPIVIVRGSDNHLRGFFNVCRHHAAAVMTEREGHANHMRCPYHGWTYSLEGELKGTPDFNDVCSFDRAENGLIPIQIAVWEKWVFARLGGRVRTQNESDAELTQFLGADLSEEFNKLDLGNLYWFERRRYTLDCNWKVFVDNYLDGGYHVPHLHKGLDSVLDYSHYAIECGERHCVQSSPMVSSKNPFGGGLLPSNAADVSAVRTGNRALYYWIYPNFMINLY